jgi:hypothetical protein
VFAPRLAAPATDAERLLTLFRQRLATGYHGNERSDGEEKLRLVFGTRVRIVRSGPKGRIEIDFGSEEELIRLFEHLTQGT